jgi:hypothetical protein
VGLPTLAQSTDYGTTSRSPPAGSCSSVFGLLLLPSCGILLNMIFTKRCRGQRFIHIYMSTARRKALDSTMVCGYSKVESPAASFVYHFIRDRSTNEQLDYLTKRQARNMSTSRTLRRRVKPSLSTLLIFLRFA